MLERTRDFVLTKEPLAVFNAAAALVTGVLMEVVHGDLPDNAGWGAIGWAVVAAGSRQLVSPAKKSEPSASKPL